MSYDTSQCTIILIKPKVADATRGKNKKTELLKFKKMITARTAKGTRVQVHIIEDCGINKGGYFCQVYTAECDDEDIDYFVIHVEDIINTKDPYLEAEKLAIKYIKSITEY